MRWTHKTITVAIVAVVLILGMAATALAMSMSNHSTPAAAPTPTPTVTQTVQPTKPAATPTTTAPAPPVQQAPAPAAPQAPSFTNAVAVLDQYYQDITNQDYQAAWNLGGSNIAAQNGQTYDSWVAGYATTASITLDNGGTWNNGTVDVNLTATETDGTVQTYAGTYTVSGGIIQSGSVTQTNAPQAAAPAAPAAPAGLTACGGGVFAGSGTSCSFALNVAANYTGLGPDYATSPVTGLSYTMNCSDSNPIICTGGNNALVQIGS